MTAWPSRVTTRFDTLLLVLMASAALTVVRASAAWSPTPLAVRAACELMATIAVSLALCFRAGSHAHAKRFAAIAICAAIIYPFPAEFVLRQFAGGSEPLELLMLSSLQLTAVVLAVFSQLPQLGSYAVLLSSFLLLFATTMKSNRITLVLAAIHGMLVLWWLMGAYWDRLAGAFVASRVERRIPVRVSVIGGTVIVLLLLATLVSTTGVSAVALQGFMPTSGGTRWHDPHARSGVGDGDAMVAAKEQAMSFGPVESELFLDSDMPSLYDMFSDMYGDPPQPKKRQERNIALAPSEVKETEQQIAKTERSGREFSAVRRKVERKPQTRDDRQAPAMLYVVGRVPLHLALERYDTFDGRLWTHSGESESRPPIRLATEDEKPWAYLMRVGSSSIHRGLEPHAVKLINLKTNRFPSPSQLTAVHVDKVDQPGFFGWTDDGIASMPVRDHIPQLTVVHLRSQGVNLEPLRESSSPGWRQVEAIVERLRTEFVLDPSVPAPEDCSDVVAHFLQAKRGPAYLFATTAAVLLRELGYETRLVTGFYARRDRFDHRAGQTSVLAEDVHVWAEVGVSGDTWVAIEPTPGYDPPRESLTWQQRLSVMSRVVCQWFWEHLAWLAFGLTLVVTSWITRVRWLDGVFTFCCSVAGRIDTQRRVLWTIRLLEWRAWLAGHPRPRSKTLSSWHGALAASLPEMTASCLQSTLRSADSLLYASRNSPANAIAVRELLAACAVVEQRVGTNCFRDAFGSLDGRGQQHGIPQRLSDRTRRPSGARPEHSGLLLPASGQSRK